MASIQVAPFNVTPVKRVHFTDSEEKAENPPNTFVSPRKIRNGHTRKRSSSFSVADNRVHFKRRRKEEFVRPTKFLLGGNSRDPLNLGSLADERVNRALNEKTPESSPIPTPKHHKEEIEVLVPSNIRDPLNLNVPLNSLAERALISPDTSARTRKRKPRNRRRRRTNSAGEVLDAGIKTEETEEFEFAKPLAVPSLPATPKAETAPVANDTPTKLKLDLPRLTRRNEDKIVSPVVPQPGARKQRTNHHLRGGKLLLPKQIAPTPVKKKDRTNFRYGNYHNYYLHRDLHAKDERLLYLKRDWFNDKEVLDVGCNAGYLTISLARDFEPRSIVGIDIDPYLVSLARKNVFKQRVGESWDFPRSMTSMYGPISYATFGNQFPNNISFRHENVVPEPDDSLESFKPVYDVITCFSVTKWIHLNWGDAGLKRFFKRIFAQLKPGGRFILEAQSWSSYSRRKKLTDEIAKNYAAIQLYPERFSDYLLSEVGFCTCEVISSVHVYVKSEESC